MFRGLKSVISKFALGALLASGLASSVAAPAQAASFTAPGWAPAFDITWTQPEHNPTIAGFGTGFGEHQITQLQFHMVNKHGSDDRANWTVAPVTSAYGFGCLAGSPGHVPARDTECAAKFLKITVIRNGVDVSADYPVSYLAFSTRITMTFTDYNTVGYTGLLEGDVVTASFAGALYNIPADAGTDGGYEPWVQIDHTWLGTGGNGWNHPTEPTYATSLNTSLVAPEAPTAVAGLTSATVTVPAATPAAAKYVITASPKVGATTKTCTVVSPDTSCAISGLTAGTAYTFTSMTVADSGLLSAPSAASLPATPYTNPTVSSVAPVSVATTGGTVITVTGTGFLADATVTVGGANCTNVTVVSATEATCTAPAGAAGSKDVVLTNANGASATKASAVTYIEFPTIASVAPAQGPIAGGTTITLTGTGFLAGATVTVGGVACTSVTVTSATEITCVTPAGSAGSSDVVVTNSDQGTSTKAGGFKYVSPTPVPPTKPAVKPAAKTIAIFAGDSAVLKSAMKTEIATWLKKVPQKSALVCTGSTSGSKVTSFDKKLANQRATNVCNYAKSLRKDLTFSIKANPSSSIKDAARNVQIAVR